MNGKYSQRCPNAKKSIAIFIAVIMVIPIFPIQNVFAQDETSKASENEKIYKDLENLMAEKDTRYAKEGDNLWNDTQGELDKMKINEENAPSITINTKTPDLKIPKQMPDIFNKLQEQFGSGFLQQILATIGLPSTVDTILDGRSYYIYANDSNGNEDWEYFWKNPLPSGNEPKIGYDFTELSGILNNLLPIPVDISSLRDLRRTPVDVNQDGTDDFTVAITVNLQDPYLVPDILVNGSSVIHARVNIILEIFNLDNYPEATVYVARPIATSNPDQIFLWAVGVGFNNTYPNFNLTATIDNFELTISLGTIRNILPPPIGQGSSITDSLGDIYSIDAPYKIKIQHDREGANLTSFIIGQGRVEPKGNDSFTIREHNYLFFGNIPSMPRYLYLFLNSKGGWTAPLDQVEVELGNSTAEPRTRTLNNITFIIYEDKHETNQNISYTDIFIENLPSFTLNMTDIYENGNYSYGIIELDAVQDIKKLQFREWNYHNLTYAQLQENDTDRDGKIDNRTMDYIYTDISIEHLPKSLIIEGTVLAPITLENRTAKSSDIISKIFETVVLTIASKLYYFYKRARSIPLSIIELPTQSGWDLLHDHNNQPLSTPIGKVKAIFTTENYIDENDDFFAFYNKKEGINKAVNTTFGWITGISLQITNLTYLESNFTDGTSVEIRFKNHTNKFKILYKEDNNKAVVEISNIPDLIKIELKEDYIQFTTETGMRINQIVYTSYVDGQTMRVKIDNVPDSIKIEKKTDYIKLSNEQEFNIDFFITTSATIKRMDGDHLLVYQNQRIDTKMISGRITGLKGFIYNSERGAYLDLNMKGGQRFNVWIENETDENDMLSLRGVIYPMPSSFTIDLPKRMTESKINTSALLNVGGLTDFGNVVYALNGLSNSVLTMLDEGIGNMFEEMTFLDSNMTFSYNSSENINIIASVLNGGDDELNKLGNVDFTHGVNLRKTEKNGKVIMNAKIFLSNLPKEVKITINSNPGDLYIDADLKDYSPKYDFLLIDIQGLRDINGLLYLNKLGKNLTISANIDLFTVSGVGKTIVIGELDIFITSADKNFTNLGQLYLRARRTVDVPMIGEIFIEKIPYSLNLAINIQNDISIDYKASSEIKYIMINIYKYIAENWYKGFILLNDLPTKVEFTMKSNSKFDMDEFLLVQGIPTITINTTSNALGLYANIEGRVLGRRANFEIEGENITDQTKLYVENGIIKLRSEGRISYMNLRIANYQLSKEYLLRSLTLHAEEIQSIDIEITTLFGKYPIIQLSNAKSGKVQLDIQHAITFNNIKFDAKVALIDAILDESSGYDFPTVAPVQVNSFYTRTPSNTKHYVIIDPISTLMITVVGK